MAIIFLIIYQENATTKKQATATPQHTSPGLDR
jgi:hypothetical protein